MRWGRTRLTVKSLSAESALNKLAREGIPVFSARKNQKNEISFEVETKDLEKVFAILRGSCYNIHETRYRGLTLLYRKCIKGMGMLIGAALFCAIVLFAQSRVLRIDVIGSGAFYREQVLRALEENGVTLLSQRPEDPARLTAQILSLPRVSYCSLKCEGGILTVEVRVSEESARPAVQPLQAPVSGRIEELIVLRGTARVAPGDLVEAGQTLVDCVAVYGEEQREVLVIARAKISYSVEEEFPGSEEEALSSAYLKYGEMEDLKAEQREHGFLITGRAFSDAAINMR